MIKSRDLMFLISNMILWFCAIICYYTFSGKICAFVLILILVHNMFYLKKQESIISVSIMFNCFYLGSLALASLQLVEIYSNTWSVITWIIFALYYEMFYVGVFISKNRKKRLSKKTYKYRMKQRLKIDDLFALYIVFTILAIGGFVYCVMISGYIPLFSLDTSAYVNFGNGSNLALFYQIAVILPAIGLYLFKHRKKGRFIIIALMGVNIVICLLVKSRDFFVGMAVIAGVVYYFEYALGKNNKIKLWKKIVIVITVIVFSSIFLWMTSQRGYSNSYLRHIYKAYDSPLSDVLLAPYVYITSGYYNLDSIVKQLDFHTYGLFTFNPILILFHISPLRTLADYYGTILQNYYIIPELNLFSSLGVPFIDGGIIGVGVTALISGRLYSFFDINYRYHKNCYSLILFAIGIHHVIMCFFTSWLSNFQYFIYIILMLFGSYITSKKDTNSSSERQINNAEK